MKILYTNGTLSNSKDPALKQIEALGHTVLYYDSFVSEKNKRLLISRHFQMYEDLFDTAEREDVDLIYSACAIGVPEYFLSELKVRDKLRAKIIAHASFREINRSLARTKVMSELLSMPQFAKMAFTSYFVKDKMFPLNYFKYNFPNEKVIYLEEPFGMGDDVKDFQTTTTEEARKSLNIKSSEFTCSFFGSWKYSKGADIFVEALKHIQKDILVILHKTDYNYEKDPDLAADLINKAVDNHSKILILNDYLSQKDFARLCFASDVIVSAHRKLYEYSFTGIPVNVAMAKKIFVAPDFFPFNEIVNRYKMGLTYYPEDPVELGNAVNSARIIYDNLLNNAEWDKALKDSIIESDRQALIIKMFTEGRNENYLL